MRPALRRFLVPALCLSLHLDMAPAQAQDAAVPVPAPPVPPAATPVTRHSSYALQLFRETCGAHFADPQKNAEVAKKYGFPANPPYSAELLYGKPGRVWDASAGGSGTIALVVIESGAWACQIHARDTDPDLLQRRFRSMMENLRSPGMKMEKYDQRKSTRDGVTLEQAGYFLYQEGKPEGWSFVLTTSTPNTPGWHATFTVAGAKRER